jgi:tRNA pseudouridine38-40 synthase
MEYDGTAFSGWQKQAGRRTVEGTIEETLKAALGTEVEIFGTSRTDAGVHALGQCCSFTADTGIPTEKLPLVLNNYLAKGKYGTSPRISDIRILSAEEKEPGFNARFDCKGKTYEYRMDTGTPSVFRKNYVYYIAGSLDIAAMNKACKAIVGTHDFASFQTSGGTPRKTTVRTVTEARVDIPEESGFGAGAPLFPGGQNDRCAVFTVTGDGFLYNMVRIMVGTLVEIGLGQREASEMADIIASADRMRAGHTAPPNGLYLKKIYF